MELDLSEVPLKDAVLKITMRRIEQLTKTIQQIETRQKLGPGDAASLTGKLGFTLCASFGRFGRAKLRPYIRRCGESRAGLNSQISAANDFWLKFLVAYTPRAIPVFMDKLDVVVSYSDGEGADAGLGIGVWSSRCPNGPLAAFCKIPESIRRLLEQTKEGGLQ